MIITDTWKHIQHTGNACHRHNLRQAYRDKLQLTYMYIRGFHEPHFPVPAIREGFEWGWDCLEDRATMIHWEQGTYEEG